MGAACAVNALTPVNCLWSRRQRNIRQRERQRDNHEENNSNYARNTVQVHSRVRPNSAVAFMLLQTPPAASSLMRYALNYRGNERCTHNQTLPPWFRAT